MDETLIKPSKKKGGEVGIITICMLVIAKMTTLINLQLFRIILYSESSFFTLTSQLLQDVSLSVVIPTWATLEIKKKKKKNQDSPMMLHSSFTQYIGVSPHCTLSNSLPDYLAFFFFDKQQLLLIRHCNPCKICLLILREGISLTIYIYL